MASPRRTLPRKWHDRWRPDTVLPDCLLRRSLVEIPRSSAAACSSYAPDSTCLETPGTAPTYHPAGVATALQVQKLLAQAPGVTRRRHRSAGYPAKPSRWRIFPAQARLAVVSGILREFRPSNATVHSPTNRTPGSVWGHGWCPRQRWQRYSTEVQQLTRTQAYVWGRGRTVTCTDGRGWTCCRQMACKRSAVRARLAPLHGISAAQSPTGLGGWPRRAG